MILLSYLSVRGYFSVIVIVITLERFLRSQILKIVSEATVWYLDIIYLS